MFKIRDLYGALGVALALIFAYLVLERWMGASRIIGSLGSETNKLFRTLQGR